MWSGTGSGKDIAPCSTGSSCDRLHHRRGTRTERIRHARCRSRRSAISPDPTVRRPDLDENALACMLPPTTGILRPPSPTGAADPVPFSLLPQTFQLPHTNSKRPWDRPRCWGKHALRQGARTAAGMERPAHPGHPSHRPQQLTCKPQRQHNNRYSMYYMPTGWGGLSLLQPQREGSLLMRMASWLHDGAALGCPTPQGMRRGMSKQRAYGLSVTLLSSRVGRHRVHAIRCTVPVLKF